MVFVGQSGAVFSRIKPMMWQALSLALWGLCVILFGVQVLALMVATFHLVFTPSSEMVLIPTAWAAGRWAEPVLLAAQNHPSIVLGLMVMVLAGSLTVSYQRMFLGRQLGWPTWIISQVLAFGVAGPMLSASVSFLAGLTPKTPIGATRLFHYWVRKSQVDESVLVEAYTNWLSVFGPAEGLTPTEVIYLIGHASGKVRGLLTPDSLADYTRDQLYAAAEALSASAVHDYLIVKGATAASAAAAATAAALANGAAANGTSWFPIVWTVGSMLVMLLLGHVSGADAGKAAAEAGLPKLIASAEAAVAATVKDLALATVKEAMDDTVARAVTSAVSSATEAATNASNQADGMALIADKAARDSDMAVEAAQKAYQENFMLSIKIDETLNVAEEARASAAQALDLAKKPPAALAVQGPSNAVAHEALDRANKAFAVADLNNTRYLTTHALVEQAVVVAQKAQTTAESAVTLDEIGVVGDQLVAENDQTRKIISKLSSMTRDNFITTNKKVTDLAATVAALKAAAPPSLASEGAVLATVDAAAGLQPAAISGTAAQGATPLEKRVAALEQSYSDQEEKIESVRADLEPTVEWNTRAIERNTNSLYNLSQITAHEAGGTGMASSRSLVESQLEAQIVTMGPVKLLTPNFPDFKPQAFVDGSLLKRRAVFSVVMEDAPPGAPVYYVPTKETPAGPAAVKQAPAGPAAVKQAPAGPAAVKQAPAGPAAVKQAPALSKAVKEALAVPLTVRETANSLHLSNLPLFNTSGFNPKSYVAPHSSAASAAAASDPSPPSSTGKSTPPSSSANKSTSSSFTDNSGRRRRR